MSKSCFTCIYVQVKKELKGKPLREAIDDRTLPICWKGKKPFRSIRDVRKYFKPLGLKFPSGWRSKTIFEILPEDYLIISVREFTLHFCNVFCYFCSCCNLYIYTEYPEFLLF